jgi:hypothetical protein
MDSDSVGQGWRGYDECKQVSCMSVGDAISALKTFFFASSAFDSDGWGFTPVAIGYVCSDLFLFGVIHCVNSASFELCNKTSIRLLKVWFC